MFPEKIKITDELINLIIDTRKEHNLTAYQLSEKIGKNKSWLPNIENKRTKNITKNDLYLLFSEFANEEDLRPEQYIVRHLPRNTMIELEDCVTAPCHHVRRMLDVDYWEDYENLSSDDFNSEMDFEHNGRNDELKKKDAIASIEELFNIIKHQLSLYDASKQDEYRMNIETMVINFQNDFERTISIYSNDFCADDPYIYDTKAKQDYICELDSLQEKIKIALSYMHFKSAIYNFINEAPCDAYNIFWKMNNWDSLSDPEDERLHNALEDIKNFHFYIYSYFDDYEKYSTIFKNASKVEYHLIFSKLYEMFELYIGVAKINYSFDFAIPDDSATHEEVEELHRQTDKILFEIEKEVRSKFKNRNSWYLS